MRVTVTYKTECVCGRTYTHEHHTMEQYVVVEVGPNHHADIYMHGYDGEDDHIYEFIKECRLDNPNYAYGKKLLRTINV